MWTKVKRSDEPQYSKKATKTFRDVTPSPEISWVAFPPTKLGRNASQEIS